jgi:hypothetical protein
MCSVITVKKKIYISAIGEYLLANGMDSRDRVILVQYNPSLGYFLGNKNCKICVSILFVSIKYLS